MDNSNPKSQIIEAIRQSTNILVTVSHDPSVDALAAALGFSLMLNKMDKHATAVFSGAIPPAISFLEPEKTFTGSISSLRDFIIALDKEKADRLRYKVEGDVVRIYITPYKTTITQDDLEFSEGDYNVDLVIALDVKQQSDIDSAISAHGRILHDATVATISLSGGQGVGTMNWFDDGASSLCEMLMSLSEALQSNILDQQIATALLTGIVSATERFSNEQTTPRVMTMSAQLMAAGANQQLIAEALSAETESAQTTPAPDQASASAKTESTDSLKIDRSDKAKSDEDQLSAELEKTVEDSIALLHDDIKSDTPESGKTTAQKPASKPDSVNEDWRDKKPTQSGKPDQSPVKSSGDKSPKVKIHGGGSLGYQGPQDKPGTRSIHSSSDEPAEPVPMNVFDYEMTGVPEVPKVIPAPAPTTEPEVPNQQQNQPAETAQPQPDNEPPASPTEASSPTDEPDLSTVVDKAPDLEASRQAVEQALSQIQTAPASEVPDAGQASLTAENTSAINGVAPPPPSANLFSPTPTKLDQPSQATPPPPAGVPFIPPPPPPPMPDFGQFPDVPPAPVPNVPAPTSSNIPPSQRGNDNTHAISANHVNLNVPPGQRSQGFGNPNSPYSPPPGSTATTAGQPTQFGNPNSPYATPAPAPPASPAPGQFKIPGQ